MVTVKLLKLCVKFVMPAALFMMLAQAAAFAQLGPKDRVNLPPTDLQRVKIGEPAPDFTLEDMDGNKISLSDFRDKKSVVLAFYRGYW